MSLSEASKRLIRSRADELLHSVSLARAEARAKREAAEKLTAEAEAIERDAEAVASQAFELGNDLTEPGPAHPLDAPVLASRAENVHPEEAQG